MSLARGFDRLAPFYDTVATVGSLGRIHASQIALLPLIPAGRRAVVLGGGTGRFLKELLESGVASTAVSIDLSPEMTRMTAARLRRAGLSARAELRVGSVEQIRDEERFDLVVTHCFLDLFEDAELLIVEFLERTLAPAGLWLFSDFSDKGSGASGWMRRTLISTLYAFFHWTCGLTTRRLPDFDAAFERTGLSAMARESLAGGVLQAAILRKSGA